jgi:hypothetical protein
MRNRTRMIAAVAGVAAALAAGSAAVASTAGGKPGAAAKTTSASEKPGASRAEEQPGHNAMVMAVAAALHLSNARVSAALAPLFAAGHADPSSPAFAAAARSLGVSPQQLATVLAQAKQSLAGATQVKPGAGGSKAAAGRSKAAEEQPAHNAMVAAVAAALHLSTARVSAALAPLFAAGEADPSSPVFASAARALGVSPQQLSTALAQAKQSVAGGS